MVINMTATEEDFYNKIERLVYEAMDRGATQEVDVYDYVASYLPIDPLVEHAVKHAIQVIVLFYDNPNPHAPITLH